MAERFGKAAPAAARSAAAAALAAFAGTAGKAVPLAGILVGVLTALTAPLLWPALIPQCWSEELRVALLGETMDAACLTDLAMNMAVPINLPLGFAAGSTMHLLLAPYLLGKTGAAGAAALPWTSTTLPVLAGTLAAAAAYFTYCSTLADEFYWEERVEAETGALYSRNCRTGERRPGSRQALKSQASRALVAWAPALRRPLGYLYDTYVEGRAGLHARDAASLSPVALMTAAAMSDEAAVAATDLRIAHVDARQSLRRVMDVVARQAHLEKEAGTAPGSEQAQAHAAAFALRECGVADLPGLLADVRGALDAAAQIELEPAAADARQPYLGRASPRGLLGAARGSVPTRFDKSGAETAALLPAHLSTLAGALGAASAAERRDRLTRYAETQGHYASRWRSWREAWRRGAVRRAEERAEKRAAEAERKRRQRHRSSLAEFMGVFALLASTPFWGPVAVLLWLFG